MQAVADGWTKVKYPQGLGTGINTRKQRVIARQRSPFYFDFYPLDKEAKG